MYTHAFWLAGKPVLQLFQEWKATQMFTAPRALHLKPVADAYVDQQDWAHAMQIADAFHSARPSCRGRLHSPAGSEGA